MTRKRGAGESQRGDSENGMEGWRTRGERELLGIWKEKTELPFHQKVTLTKKVCSC